MGRTGPRPVLVTITEEDIEDLRQLAQARNAGKPQASFRGSRQTKYPPNLTGLIGEYAFSRWSGLDLDVSISPDGDQGYDFVLEDSNLTVDVVTRTIKNFPYPEMIRPPRSTRADLFVLARFNEKEPHQVQLVGYCTKQELLAQGLSDLGRLGKQYVMPNHLLHELRKKGENSNEIPC